MLKVNDLFDANKNRKNKAREVYFEPSTNGMNVDKFDSMAKRLGMKKEAKYRRVI